MAGRGFVEPRDTLSNERILSINPAGELVYAKEPLHWYEPVRTGLDCGLSFAQTLLESVPDNVSLLILPTAIGGSSIQQWLGDSIYHDVQLLSNFKEKVAIGKKYGNIKGILWHQGESDANERGIAMHQRNLSQLTGTFRTIVQNPSLPIIMGELGSFSTSNANWQLINKAIRSNASGDNYTSVINMQDLKTKGDNIHFNAAGQREIGKRFAKEYLSMQQ